MNILNKVFVRLFLNKRGLVDPLQLVLSAATPDILIIGPGIKKIPPSGWGAVELICDWHFQGLQSEGYNVDLLNSRSLVKWWIAFRRRPKVVLLHYDSWSRRTFFFSRLFLVPAVGVTHYAYAGAPEKWDRYFIGIAKWLLRLNGLVALNDQIEKTFREQGFRGPLLRWRNHIPVERFKVHETRSGLIVLGKVESRKRQYELCRALTPKNLEKVVFVGPIADSRVGTLPSRIRRKFLGEWTREETSERLGAFEGLILASDGEADALVLYEAQSAGLQVYLSQEAIGSQDTSLPWVQVFSCIEELDRLLGASDQSSATASEIASWAKKNYALSSGLRSLTRFLEHFMR